MKKKYSLVFIVLLCSVLSVFGQVTIFSENMGTRTEPITSIAASTFQNSEIQTFIGDADTRTSTTSSGYANASGGRNVFFTNTIGRYFEISEINTIGFSDLTLTLGHYKSAIAGNNELAIEVSADGITYTPLNYSRATGNGTAHWILITPIGTIPSTNNLRIRFTQTSASTQFRIDDINLSGMVTSTNFVDFCNLQFPQNGNITVGTAFNVYAQVYEAGVTETSFSQGTNIEAWIGYSSTNTNPNTWTNWVTATYNNVASGNNDEYVANIGSMLPSGNYYYASRFQIDSGPYRYGGYSTTGGGFWNGTSHVSGILSVDTVDFCNLQFPGMGTINLGNPFAVYGQVYEQAVTPGAGQGAGIVAQVGYSTSNSNPRTWTNWIPASYNAACGNCNSGQNDEYAADLGSAITTAGTYYYATRFSLNGGAWLYGGILADGSDGNFWDGTTYISGVLHVITPEIRVEGNVGTFPEIGNGNSTPQGTDGTLFAAQYIEASQSKSYRIRNLGNLDLTVFSVYITGVNPGDFMITKIPDTTILPGEFSILEIQFSPLVVGVRNATVSIVNNDRDENPYTFAIRGTGLCVTTSNTITPSIGPTGTIATITGTHFDGSTIAHINGISMPTTFINENTIEVTIPANATTGNIVIKNNLNCTSTTSFTVIDNRISGCESIAYLSDLFISEVTDATVGGLSYVEIYNGTGSAIALGGYSIGIYSNGAATPSSTIVLNSFNLPNNSTYIIAIGVVSNPSDTNSCLQTGGNGQFAHQTSGVSGINKKDNEHDAIRLLKSGGTIVVDQFGVYMDKTWMDATIITGDRGFNFRRLNSATSLPNPDFNLNDWNIIDWVGSGRGSCGTNDYSDIGFYDYSGGNPPTITLQPLAPNSTCAVTATLSVLATEGLDGGFPLAYQWHYNAPGTSNWIEILDTNPDYSGQQSESLTILNTIDFDAYQYYAQVRENSVTCYTASNAVRLKIDTTTWNGNSWTPTAPNTSTVAILNGNYTTTPATGSFTVCSLIINSGYTLNITDNYYVEAINDVIVNGNLVVETKAALVQRGDGIDSGTFTLRNSGTSSVNKSTSEKQHWYDYTYWSSPVTNETAEFVLSMASPSRRFYFKASNFEDTNADDVDDNGDDWQFASGRMLPGVGYASTSNNSGTFPRVDTSVFNGEFNTGDISVSIHGNNSTPWNDWNFIGNPYASAIDFKLVHSENTDVISGAAYLWSQARPPLASNPGNQVLNFSQNDYAIISTGSGNIAGGKSGIPSDFIPSGQGFFVIGINSGGTLTFNNSMRMADDTSNSKFYRNGTDTLANKFWIDLTSDNGVFNQILMAYVEGATNGVDGFAYDVERNLSSGLSAIIYTEIVESNKKYAIQGKSVHSLSLDEEIPIGFKSSITQPTVYKLSIAQLQGKFFNENTIYLKDNLLNIYHDLSSAEYNFTSETGDFNNRFVIVFQNETLSGNEISLNTKDLSIIEHSNGQIQFSIGHNLTIKSVEIMDLLGRSLYFLKGNSGSEVYDLNQLSQTAYIAKIELSNGQIIIKRAIKRH
ncbi:choice-of-anchor D domain-containing protein [Gelidibacter sp.]|uniref:choice-of-anchor D domain-containing protein n=1 Tax=Gelidibacter sp. TaxID=2018083 RepID=UPI00326316F5